MGRSVCDELSCKQNDQINYDFTFTCKLSAHTVVYGYIGRHYRRTLDSLALTLILCKDVTEAGLT